ncbi:hypothetical protein [Singulisphaera sp. PoT]|uniref:hypothetical protein n=1 Tax=Singulisphaera sp. PoT TaxID=3411797 RepID=UPI003BF5F020
MPLTPFQREVARILAANRNPESYIAGGAAINRGEGWLRFSSDLDIFNDMSVIVSLCASEDAKFLEFLGYSVEWKIRHDGVHRAQISKGEDSIRLDWVNDTAFRFFPVQKDEDFGYCLHPADLATNKALACVGRHEIRDFIDILQIDEKYLSVGAVVWAACSKDPGFTPDFMLDFMNRHSNFRPDDLLSENLAREVDLREMKIHWLEAKAKAQELFAQLPEDELGCLYLDASGNPVTPNPLSADFASLIRHRGSVRGVWPEIS